MKKCICHDCGKTLEQDEEYMPYKIGDQEFAKCKACHQKDPVLKNFQKTEVYSRVVGYIRPVEQWNNAKKSEFGDRTEYTDGCCSEKDAKKEKKDSDCGC